MPTKLEAQLAQFARALQRLQEVLAVEQSDITRDSAIQRFEFTLDLAWKTTKTFLEEQKGVVCASPKDCFRAAHQHGLIAYDERWIALVDMRNETMHTYSDTLAAQVFARLPEATNLFTELLTQLRA